MSANTVEFVNPDNLPIEHVTLTVSNDGVVKQVKALDPYWVDKRKFTLYQRPPSGSALILGAVDTWKTRTKLYLDNLKYLLGLEYHRFWSTIIHNKKCMDSLVSFLQEANPPYLRPHESRDVEQLYGDIRRYVFIVFCRLITNKESERHWMTKEHMAATIYNNFIFTIPIVWDICLIYGLDNKQAVSRLVSSVFALQPAYERDVHAAVAFVNEAFKYIILQVNKDYDSEEPPNLPDTFKGFFEINRPSSSKTPDKFTVGMLKDLAVHLLDTAMTLRIFVEIYPKGVEILRKTNTVNSIVQIYEYGIPQLYKKLQEVGDETSVLYTEVEQYIDMARSEMIDVFREILAVYKNNIFSGEGSISSHVENYLTVMMDGLSERLLIKDYHSCYPVHEDIDMLRQAYPDIDTVKTDFILQAIYSNLDEPIPENLLSEATNGYREPIEENHNQPGPSTDKIDDIPDNVKEESLISEVKDILPHLGDGFILKCLQHYGFNAERVINSILEDNLAKNLRGLARTDDGLTDHKLVTPSLLSQLSREHDFPPWLYNTRDFEPGLDQSLPIIPEDPLDQKFLETGVARLNVFDGDEFDIMTRDDVDVSRIHVGKKKSKYKNLKDMLNDKSEINKEDIYNKYNLVCDEEAMYSDEYDDSYDVVSVVPAGDATEDEPRRPFVTPRALMPRVRQESDYESESSEEKEEEKPSSSKSRMDFCVNPEEMRARREANMQARRGKGHRPPPTAAKDVTGKPRGQGQEKDVLVNRDRKEKHKSVRGNHARRQGAQWKRSQGMMPS